MRASLRLVAASAALLAVLATGSAAAQDSTRVRSPNGGITGVDVMTATVFQEGQSSFSGLAARLRIRDARLVRNLEILPTVEYWQNTSKLSSYDVKVIRRDATLGGDVRWVFPHQRWEPYAGVGLSLHFLEDQLKAPPLGVPDRTTSTVRGAIALLGGVQFGMADKLGSFLEVKWHDVKGYRQLKINTGLGWNF